MKNEETIIGGTMYCLRGRVIDRRIILLGGGTVVAEKINYGDVSKAESIFAEIKAKNITFRQAGDNIHA